MTPLNTSIYIHWYLDTVPILPRSFNQGLLGVSLPHLFQASIFLISILLSFV